MKKSKIKLIYNPNSGKKLGIFSNNSQDALQVIKDLFERYQLSADFFRSGSEKEGIRLAKEAKKEGYQMVVVAGGDGSVAAVAHGLVGKGIPLGIIPMGSVMNVAKMLSIPTNLELAVSLIKIGRTYNIDLGEIVKLDGEKMQEPSYFIEQAGVGFDADYRYYLSSFFKGQFGFLPELVRPFIPLFKSRVEVEIDGKVVERKARMVIISNGPYSGLGLEFSPKSKLNDRVLTVSIFTFDRFGLIKFLVNLFLRRYKAHTKKVKVMEAKSVKLRSRQNKLIHADARVFGTTPAEFRIVPQSLNVVIGFPEKTSASLKTRTA